MEYQWKHLGRTFTALDVREGQEPFTPAIDWVEAEFNGIDGAEGFALDACAFEILRLAERVRELEATVAMRDGTLAMAVARLGGEVEGAPTHRGNFLQRIDELRRAESDLWAATITAEEGQEIEAEVTAALAVLAGEALEPCAAGRPGHLGPKARAACREALDHWHALEAENRRLRAAAMDLILQEERFVRESGVALDDGVSAAVVNLKAALAG